MLRKVSAIGLRAIGLRVPYALCGTELANSGTER